MTNCQAANSTATLFCDRCPSSDRKKTEYEDREEGESTGAVLYGANLNVTDAAKPHIPLDGGREERLKKKLRRKR
ncbi:hypothetical protein JZ751_001493 [Albula glossodonta]|uniref:Uncharacterized protein n=1 Tax=Albula glossodonta TaxID=121402 RepID=A0A8T2PTU3_9TELE|nr:hypothetical protein JZ751_001493 [Albula glossodonta]